MMDRGLLRFVVRRLAVAVPTVLAVVTITWALVRLAPGNFYTGDKKLPPAVEQNLRDRYGLDQPWHVQYGRVIGGVLRLDFGNSLKYEGQPVNDILRQSLPISAALGACAYLIALLAGVAAGALAALRQNTRLDYASMALAMLGISIPSFVLGPVLVMVFSLSLYWLPPARWGGFPSWNMVLPVVTLAAAYTAYVARLSRAGLLEVLRSDYVRTARAKGLSERAVVLRHAMRGGLLPVVSFTGPALAMLIAGTVVVERIFAIPGLGNYFYNASFNRDEPLIIGIVAFISIVVLAFNLLVDVAYAYIDPRIRY
jgi:oligopeptide transport system permease protein